MGQVLGTVERSEAVFELGQETRQVRSSQTTTSTSPWFLKQSWHRRALGGRLGKLKGLNWAVRHTTSTSKAAQGHRHLNTEV